MTTDAKAGPLFYKIYNLLAKLIAGNKADTLKTTLFKITLFQALHSLFTRVLWILL